MNHRTVNDGIAGSDPLSATHGSPRLLHTVAGWLLLVPVTYTLLTSWTALSGEPDFGVPAGMDFDTQARATFILQLSLPTIILLPVAGVMLILGAADLPLRKHGRLSVFLRGLAIIALVVLAIMIFVLGAEAAWGDYQFPTASSRGSLQSSSSVTALALAITTLAQAASLVHKLNRTPSVLSR
jgi:hypothetical protein